MAIRAFLSCKSKLFDERLLITNGLVSCLYLSAQGSCFIRKQLEFNFEVFSSAETNSHLIELILDDVVVVLEPTDLAYVVIQIIRRTCLTLDTLSNLSLDFLLSSPNAHFNNKIINTINISKLTTFLPYIHIQS